MAGEGNDETAALGTVTTMHAGVTGPPTWAREAARYRLGAEIARGGGGRVVAATDERLGREVAVKLPLDGDAGAGAARRLVREAQLMSRLEHPSIVPVHDLARDADGAPFYVMKLLAGDTLRARIAERAFEERIALLPTLIAIAEAVAYAHRQGIVHRDLKPANVIVGEFGETFVIDWGLARRVAEAEGNDPPRLAESSDGVTLPGAVVGTPAYMAPEQARGESAGVRTDVYGLGALAYHVLGGAAPYAASSSTEIVACVLAGPPQPLAEREARVPAELAAIVGKAMAREPGDRYPSAAELAADLRHYQAGRLVAAHRYSLAQRARRFVRRHRAALVGGAALAAAGVALALAWPAAEPPAAMCGRAGDAARRALDADWSPAQRGEIAAHVRGLGVPGAGPASDAIAARVESYERALAAAHAQACTATHVDGTQSAALLDRRVLCLSRARQDLGATLAQLARVSPQELDAAVRASGALPPLAACANPSLLADRVPPPSDPFSRARVNAQYAQVAITHALLHVGRYREAAQTGRALVASLGAAPFAPTAARAHYALGEAYLELGQRADATAELHAALADAERGRDDEMRGNAIERFADLAVELATEDATPASTAEAARRVDELEAVAERLDNPSLRADALTMRSQLAENRGALTESIEDCARAVAFEERANDADGLAMTVSNLGMAYTSAGRYPEAVPYLVRATALYATVYGTEHPSAARMVNAMANNELGAGKFADAVLKYRHALELFERAGLGATREVDMLRANLAAALGATGHVDEAEATLVALLAARGSDALGSAHVLFNLGVNCAQAGQHDRAIAWLRKALASDEQRLGADHEMTAQARYGLANELVETGHAADAVPLLVAALPVLEREDGQDSEMVNGAQAALARAYLFTGQPARAAELGARTLPYFEHTAPAADRGAIRLLMARALLASGGDRARAKLLATEARADYVEANQLDNVADVDKTLSTLK